MRTYHTTIRTITHLCLVAGLAATAHAQCSSDKLIASDPAASDWFSTSTAVSGSFAVLGASGKDTAGNSDTGAAYFFAKNGLNWVQTQKVTASDAAAGDNFGYCASISGDYAIIGSPRDTYAGFYHLGSAYVFHRVNGVWVQEYNILVPSANRGADLRFALSVAIDGTTAVVGSEFENNGRGAAYVYTRSGTTWTLQQRIAGPGLSGLFGSAVSLDGDHMIVGAYLDDSNVDAGTGAAYVYERVGTTWTLHSTLSGQGTIINSRFGDSVSISNGRAVVVAPDVGSTGRAYTFVRNGLGHWLHDTDFDGAGTATLKDDTLMLSRYDNNVGHVDEFHHESNQFISFWAAGPTHSAGGSSDGFGWQIAYDGQNLLVAAPSTDNPGAADSGAAYAFETSMVSLTGRCGTATPIDVNTTVTGCTQGFLRDGYSGCDIGGSAPDVYFTFTATCAGTYAFSTAGSMFDTMLSLHSACPATSANSLACNDDVSGTDRTSYVSKSMNAGETVLIRVSGYAANSGVFNLSVTPSAPSNDDCAHPMTIQEGQFSFDNCFAQNNLQLDNITMEGDLWYKYSPVCSGTATLDACGNNAYFDTLLAVYHGGMCTDVFAPNRLVLADDVACMGGFTYTAGASFPVVAGEDYLIRIGGYPFTGAGTFNRGHAIYDLELATACPADFNQDGGVDGTDVQAFFAAWDAGLARADVNCDGGVDGSDVDTFFSSWENGGC
ncbi:MAG: hypothetical protein JSR77_13375 [Planctomycetes bacterium]|nr:hypothetical protein [Planctomycetota bacterium]